MAAGLVVRRFQRFAERVGDAGLRDDWIRDWGGVEPPWHGLAGHCTACGGAVHFRLADGGTDAGNLREFLHCPRCGLNARVRAAIGLLRSLAPMRPDRAVYFTEQATPTFAWAQSHLGGRVLGSEFEPDPEARVRLADHLHSLGGHGTVDFGDVTALAFADASLDAIVSLDVLEHVPDYPRAFAEFRRVLRDDGVLVATFPFLDAQSTLVRARLSGEGVEHLCEPEYHGDPLGEGVLCWYHFGWDVLDVARSAGFRQAWMVMPCGQEVGLPYGLWTLVATASAAPLEEWQ